MKSQTLNAVQEAHRRGYLDPDIAHYADVSIATVKRARAQLGLETHSKTAQRGKLGERLTEAAARQQGFEVSWREHDNAPYDLKISGRKVEVKTTKLRTDDRWNFSLPSQRNSFFATRQYSKDYAHDSDVVVLVALDQTEQGADFYLFDSATVPSSVTIRLGGMYEARRNDWSLLRPANKIQA